MSTLRDRAFWTYAAMIGALVLASLVGLGLSFR